ncbi:hypothetical protein BS47DRAFT_1341767 [Hydnum rufescens UP504]|uniref:Uncharacterized protein n=1 Tax=Hydnum rufescens UP504 TaxID=1448309 RepID=A0A9P6B0V1_9AGAM|nr:hypothetical protein BS47DRAFT_1341767 [Hydnum rufescens UP504]
MVHHQPPDGVPMDYPNRPKLGTEQLAKGYDTGKLKSLLSSCLQIDLTTIAVQRMARYRQIRWPFYHQFTVVTTVQTPPAALKPEMFSLTTKGGRRILLDDLDPSANGISFRIDRGSRSQLEIEEFASQANFDRIEILLPGTKPLGGPEASNFELIWCLTRKSGVEPTQFSLRVGDIALFVKWISQLNEHYDLLRNNCWIMCTSLSHLILLHYFQYEFDRSSSAELAAMRASRGPIRERISNFFSGPTISFHWIAKNNRHRVEAYGKRESTNSRNEIPFLS